MYRVEIGPYWLNLPSDAILSAHAKQPAPEFYQHASTHWEVDLGRFTVRLHLSPLEDLGGLKRFIDGSTKGDVNTPSLEVNGIPGVTFGGYGPGRTLIDWWFKKGEMTICLSLSSKAFPTTIPTVDELAEHRTIVESLRYCRDFPTEKAP